MRVIKSEQLPYGNRETLELTKDEVDALRVESKAKFPKAMPNTVFYGNDVVTVQPDGSGVVSVYYSIGD